jgi:hypothetical protein
MNTIMWFLALALLGIATGRIVGTGLTFTGGRASRDMVAGLLGALVVAVPLRLSGVTGYSDTLQTLIVGVTAAMLATWLTRIATWKTEPLVLTDKDRVQEEVPQLSSDVMTTGDGTRLFLSGGRLVAPDIIAPAAESAGPA